jgi:hypothetical protein
MLSGYGLENLILEKARLPTFLPLIPNYDHGWMLVDNLPDRFKKNPSKIHLAWNKRIQNMYSNFKNKKSYVIGSPFLFYKEKYNIFKKKNKGTLFFFSHGTDKINVEIDLNKFLKGLNSIPSYLKPIDICLHYNDLNVFKNFFNINGFNVYTSGSIYSNYFVKNFYKLISEYSYTASNTLGSYVLYSINLDIPFFLIGEEPIYDNFGNDENVPRYYKLSDYNYAKKTIPLFKKIYHKVTQRQKKFVSNELGEFNRLNRNDLKKIILNSYLEIFDSYDNFNSFLRSVARPLKASYKYLFR